MSYTPTNWSAGDTITAAKLNKIEQGIVAANDPYPGYDVVIKYNYVDDTNELVKGSAQVIYDKVSTGQLCRALYIYSYIYGDVEVPDNQNVYESINCNYYYYGDQMIGRVVFLTVTPNAISSNKVTSIFGERIEVTIAGEEIDTFDIQKGTTTIG